MEALSWQPPRGYRLNQKTFAGELRYLSAMPMYLDTTDAGIAYILKRGAGQSTESALEVLCDRLGGHSLADVGVTASGGPGRKRKRGSHGGWKSRVLFYGKEEEVQCLSRKCAAPMVCPRMPDEQRYAEYGWFPKNDTPPRTRHVFGASTD